MRNKIALIIILLFVLAIQDAWMPFHAIRGVMPCLPLIYVVFIALFKGERYGLYFGAIVGLLMDLSVGKYLGLNLLAMTLTGFSVGRVMQNFYKANVFIPMGSVALACVIYYPCYLFLGVFAGTGVPFWKNIISYVPFATIYNTLLGIIFYVLTYLIFERILKKNFFD